jgi:DNA-binding winged helix-turn-helix (wHTH) protein
VTAPLRFGDWVFDGETRELRGRGGPVHLSPKAFDLLGALLERRPRVLSKQELRDRLWPRTFVSDSNLSRLVKEVRRALGDRAHEPAYLRTVHAFGYAFCADAVEAPRSGSPGPVPDCRLSASDRESRLSPGENVVGRFADATPWIESATVSRRHARILVTADGATLEDLGSKNGTFLRGERLAGPAALADGDQIRLGSAFLTFRMVSASDSTKTDTASPRVA